MTDADSLAVRIHEAYAEAREFSIVVGGPVYDFLLLIGLDKKHFETCAAKTVEASLP